MKKRKNVNRYLHICLIFALLFVGVKCFGLESSAAESQTNEYSLVDERVEGIIDDFSDALPEEMEGLLDPYTSSDKVGLTFLLESAFSAIKGEMGAFFSFLLSLLGMSLLMALASQQEGEIGRACRSGVFLVTSALILDKVFETVDSVGNSLEEINLFFGSVIPVITAVNTLGISPGVAAAQSTGMSLTLQIYSFFSGSFLYSFVGVMLVISSLSAIDSTSFGKISASLKKVFLTVMGALTAFVGATFSLQSLISSAADSGAMRGAKYAVSGMIPIVGSSISGALATLTGGVSYLKGVVGGGAIAAVVALALAPLVTLLIYRACFNLTIFFVGLCTSDGAEGVLGSFVSVFDCLIAIYSLTVSIYVLQLAVFLKGGVGLA